MIAKNCFEGCVDPGLINFTGLSEYLKLKKIKVGLMSEGPDELLGGYFTDQEAHQIDRIYFDKKKKNRSNLKNLIKGFNLIKDKKFKIKYSPFKTRVTHYNDNDHFLELIINNFKKKTKFSSFNDVNFKFKNKFTLFEWFLIRKISPIKLKKMTKIFSILKVLWIKISLGKVEKFKIYSLIRWIKLRDILLIISKSPGLYSPILIEGIINSLEKKRNIFPGYKIVNINTIEINKYKKFFALFFEKTSLNVEIFNKCKLLGISK